MKTRIETHLPSPAEFPILELKRAIHENKD